MLTVTRIDRLARSTFDLFGIVKRIVDAGARFRSLAEPWADTSNSTGRLMLAMLIWLFTALLFARHGVYHGSGPMMPDGHHFHHGFGPP